MKTILTEYFGVFIAVLVGIAVISFLVCVPGMKAGIFTIGGQVMEVYTGDNIQNYENKEYDSFLLQKPLHISYIEENPIYAETAIKVQEHFSVTDEAGNLIPYQVYDVYDKAGNSCYNQVVSSVENLKFEIPGVYQILIKTQGENRKNVSTLIAFPVKAKEKGV